jgi:hypothetical protein
MVTDTIKTWLKRKRRNEFAEALLLCGLAFICGAIVLGLTVGAIFAVVLSLALHSTSPNREVIGLSLAITSGITLLMFIDAARRRRDDMSTPAKAWMWAVAEGLYIGPRLVLDGFRRTARICRLARLDIRSCANVLSYLAARDSSVPKQELTQAFPDLIWSRLTRHLRLISGVLFLREDLSRVTLTQPLRLELRRFLGNRPRVKIPVPEPEPEPVPVNEPERLGPCEILGVRAGASQAEIKTAYHNRVKECHPDRFAGMDQASLQLAEEWTKAVNAAYATLTAGHAGRRL